MELLVFSVMVPIRCAITFIELSAHITAEDEALDALIALGFPLKEATAALSAVDP